MQAWLQKILEMPTASVPDAGRAFGIGETAAYDAAKRGEIPTVRFGNRKRVPTSWIKQQLGLDDVGKTEAA